jgi:hypothetical protein
LDVRVLLLPTLSKLLGKRRFPNFPRSLFDASDWSLMRNNLGVGQLFGFQALIAYIRGCIVLVQLSNKLNLHSQWSLAYYLQTDC